MVYGFMDESGAPGKAAYRGDCLLVSLIIFASEDTKELGASKVGALREKLKLPENYEFHCSSNFACRD